MSKITIQATRNALNECPDDIGGWIEDAVYYKDAIWLLSLVQSAINVHSFSESPAKFVDNRGESGGNNS